MTHQPRVRGLNHLTLAVADLERSIAFYSQVLGCQLRARWKDGAYLEAGALWLCLSKAQETAPRPPDDYTHYAFDADANDFDAIAVQARANATLWKENRSEGTSLYFLDPDGHQLELHVGSLASRLSHYRTHAKADVEIFAAE